MLFTDKEIFKACWDMMKHENEMKELQSQKAEFSHSEEDNP